MNVNVVSNNTFILTANDSNNTSSQRMTVITHPHSEAIRELREVPGGSTLLRQGSGLH